MSLNVDRLPDSRWSPDLLADAAAEGDTYGLADLHEAAEWARFTRRDTTPAEAAEWDAAIERTERAMLTARKARRASR